MNLKLEIKYLKWLSIGEMEEDFDIMSKNDDVIAFVKKKVLLRL